MSEDRQYCTFHLHDLFLGIEVLTVQEVIREQPTTPVPLAHAAISGLINLRGQIVEAIDLRTRLGLPPRAAGESPMNVIVRTDDGPVSLLADVIGDVVSVDEASFEPPPETLAASARELISGVYKLPDRLLLVLDTARVLHLQDATAGEDR
jgi:purine-binding chemotaxis protein CheW